MRKHWTSVLLMGFALCASVQAASLSGYYQITCLVDEGIAPCSTGAITIGGPISAEAPAYSSPHFGGSYDSFWGVHYEASVALSYDFRPDLFRSLATAATVIANPISGAEIGHGNAARGYVEVEVKDGLSFSAGSLAPGTPVSFKVTADLHSVFSTNEDAVCSPGQLPDGYAALALNGASAYHSTCGDGSDFMHVSISAQSTVGGRYALDTVFRLQGASASTNPNPGSFFMTSDASHTVSLQVEVLTGGVSFASDSGALYRPLAVPESPSAALMLSGLGGLAFFAFTLRRGRSQRPAR